MAYPILGLAALEGLLEGLHVEQDGQLGQAELSLVGQ
jgi:hypothetical protein